MLGSECNNPVTTRPQDDHWEDPVRQTAWLVSSPCSRITAPAALLPAHSRIAGWCCARIGEERRIRRDDFSIVDPDDTRTVGVRSHVLVEPEQGLGVVPEDFVEGLGETAALPGEG